jgi:hypothetical protein
MMNPGKLHPLNKESSKGGKEKTKREHLSLSQKDKPQRGSQKGKGTTHVLEPRLITISIIWRDKNLEKQWA